ncbi:hypothetical protein ACWFRT_13640 [Streptomyces anulatus]
MTAPSMADEPRRVQITADGMSGRIVIDGTDLSKHLRGFALEHSVGGPPTLVLYANAHHGLQFEGVAHVVVGEQQDPGQTVAAFLANIDPAALSRAALNRDDLDGTPHELTRAMLMTLTDMTLGRGGT